MRAWHLPLPRKNLTQCPGSVDHYSRYTAAAVGYDNEGKPQVLSAHWSKRDALGAISNFKAGEHVNFNYREKLVGEPFLVTSPEEGVSPAPTPDLAPATATDPALAPEPDPAQVEAMALLPCVIDGTASIDAALADRLLTAHEKFTGGAEFDPLFEQASQAYADAMIAKARTALAAELFQGCPWLWAAFAIRGALNNLLVLLRHQANHP